MQGADFLEVAKDLAKSHSEAALRSAVSRAYYALFNVAAQVLIEWGFVVSQGPGAHGEVRNRFSNCGIEQVTDFVHSLDELRARRNQADYNMNSKAFDNRTHCALLVASAGVAIQTLKEFRQEPLRRQIQTGIREYERKIKHS